MSNLFQLSGRATAARSPFLNILSRTRFVDAAWRALRVRPPLAEDDGRCPDQAVQRGGLFISLNNRATARAMGKKLNLYGQRIADDEPGRSAFLSSRFRGYSRLSASVTGAPLAK